MAILTNSKLRKDQDRLKLRKLILEGASSGSNLKPVDKKYFDALRERAKKTRDERGAKQ